MSLSTSSVVSSSSGATSSCAANEAAQDEVAKLEDEMRWREQLHGLFKHNSDRAVTSLMESQYMRALIEREIELILDKEDTKVKEEVLTTLSNRVLHSQLSSELLRKINISPHKKIIEAYIDFHAEDLKETHNLDSLEVNSVNLVKFYNQLAEYKIWNIHVNDVDDYRESFGVNMRVIDDILERCKIADILAGGKKDDLDTNPHKRKALEILNNYSAINAADAKEMLQHLHFTMYDANTGFNVVIPNVTRILFISTTASKIITDINITFLHLMKDLYAFSKLNSTFEIFCEINNCVIIVVN